MDDLEDPEICGFIGDTPLTRDTGRRLSDYEREFRIKLIDEIWDLICTWSKLEIGFSPGKRCRIFLVSSERFDGAFPGMTHRQAAGLYYGKRDDERHGVWLHHVTARRDIDYYLVVLIHEYMHHLHRLMVSDEDWRRCPTFFKEGFAEAATRKLFLDTQINATPECLKAWTLSYRFAQSFAERVIYKDGKGLKGFVHEHLIGIPEYHPYRSLEPMFGRE